MRWTVFTITSTIAAAVGAAPPKGAPVGYEAKYAEVIAAEKSEEFEKALTLLDQIPTAKHNIYTRLKRAGLLVRLGRFVEAEAMLAMLVKDPAADAIRATAQGDLDDVRARMPKLTIRLAAGAAKDAWVTLDGQPVGPPVTVPVDPGAHVLVATRGGKDVFRQKVTLVDSQALDVEIDTSIAPSTAPGAAVPAPVIAPTTAAPPSATEAPRRTSWAPVVLTSIGLATVGVGAFFGLAARSKLAASNEPGRCDGANHCSAEGAELRRASLLYADVSTVLFIGGAVVAAAGVTWTVVSRRGVTATASLAPGGLLIAGTFR